MESTCPRCGGATGEARWCETCGLDLTGQPSLPTDEAIEAGRREAAWLEAHPDAAESERRAAEPPPAAWGTPPAAAQPLASPYGAPSADAPPSPYGAPSPGPSPSPWGPPAYGAPASPWGPPGTPAIHFEPARDPSRLAQVTRLMLIAHAVIALVTLALEFVYLDALAGTTPEDYPFSTSVDEAWDWVSLLYVMQFFALLITAGFFIAWLHRVYKNTRPLGAYELRHSPGWAIGGWFVPILAYWRPLQIVNDAWRASNPKLGIYAHRRDWESERPPWQFLAWWILFNVWATIQAVSGAMIDQEELTLDEDRAATIVSMCAAAPGVASALFGIWVIDHVTNRQKARAAARERMGPPTPTGPPPVAPPPMADQAWGTPPPQPAPGEPPAQPQRPGEEPPRHQWLPPGGHA